MKIVHVIETLNLGGAERVVADLCNVMAGEHDVVVCCLKETGVMASRICGKVTVECLHKRAGNQIGFVGRLAAFLAGHRPDVVHLHSLGALLELAAAMFSYGKCTFVVTCHGHLSHYSTGQLKTALRKTLEIPAFLSADRVVTVSDELRRLLPRPVAAKATTVYNGVPVDNALPEISLGGRATRIVFAGRLAQVKNLPTLVRAVKQVRDSLSSGASLQLHLLGEGPEGPGLRRLVRELEMASCVKFHGYVEDVRRWYERGDIFVLPSQYEGISISLLEAMAEGVAVIATRVGGNVEVVQDGVSGLLVDYGDERMLADAIAGLVRYPARRTLMARNGFNRVKEAFNVEAVAWHYLRLYQTRQK